MPQSLFDLLVEVRAFVERILAAPPTPGVEDLLIEKGHDPLPARVMSRFIWFAGKQWAEERNTIEKPLASALRRIVKHSGTASRPCYGARMLHALIQRGDADSVIQRVLEKSGSQLSTPAFCDLVGLAANGDERSCYRLIRIARRLMRYLPDPRGKPVSAQTGVHLFLLSQLAYCGHPTKYTWSPEHEDFVDGATKATRFLLGNPCFDPRPAYRLYRMGTIPDA